MGLGRSVDTTWRLEEEVHLGGCLLSLLSLNLSSLIFAALDICLVSRLLVGVGGEGRQGCICGVGCGWVGVGWTRLGM